MRRALAILRRVVLLLALCLIGEQAEAATYYLSRTNACAGTYSIALDNCTGSDGTSYTSTAIAISAMVSGDTLNFRNGIHNQRLLVVNKSGLTFQSHPGESAILKPTTVVSSYSVLFSGGTGNVLIKLEFNGTAWPNDGFGWRNEGGLKSHDR